MSDVLVLPDVIDPVWREQLLAELRALDGEAATVSGASAAKSVVPRARKATRLPVAAATRERFEHTLSECSKTVGAHFGATFIGCEEPQFLRYRTGDYFVAHQDGNTPLIHDATRYRKISVVLFLSAAGDYTGGELVLHGSREESWRRERVDPLPGALVAFRAETTHEVLPVTGGERYTVVSWYL